VRDEANAHATPDITATNEFIETALHRRRRASAAPLTIDDVAELLRRVRRLWNELGMVDYERRALADVVVRAPPGQASTSPGATSRSSASGRRRSGSSCNCRNEEERFGGVGHLGLVRFANGITSKSH
jgi:hypothetical protein